VTGILGVMPSLRPNRARRTPGRPRIVVVGDLVVDVVLRPDQSLEHGSDVPGRITLTQGGSAANTARWLGRLGARSSLVAAVGRDAPGRALVKVVRIDRVTPHVIRVAGARTGRIGVLLAPDGERTFVQDRGAAVQLRPADLKPAWFARADAIHLPIYSLLDEPLGLAGRRAIELGRAAGAAVSLDLASIGPLLARGRRAARSLIAEIAPDILFATASEAEALLGRYAVEGLLDAAMVAVVKRGSKGATVLAREGDRRLRFEVATTPISAADTTGAGDAFDAGFLVGWFTSRAAGRALPASLQRAAVTGHRAAGRQLSSVRAELPLG
jgi:sugar/nucleoside kinase (ribokinase family)